MMLNRAEFSVGERVTYWDGKKFYKATVHNLILNPIDNVVEYQLFYRSSGGSKGHHKVRTKPDKIKQSVHFKEDKNDVISTGR